MGNQRDDFQMEPVDSIEGTQQRYDTAWPDRIARAKETPGQWYRTNLLGGASSGLNKRWGHLGGEFISRVFEGEKVLFFRYQEPTDES